MPKAPTFSSSGGAIVPTDTSVYDPSSGAVLSPYQPIKGEPAVLSSVSGAESFASNVQPKIDQANANVTDAQTRQEAAKKAVADAFGATPNNGGVPADVQAELDANKTDAQKAYEARLANYDDLTKSLTDLYSGLSISSTNAANAQIASLTNQWQQRRALLQKSNDANVANWTQQFFRYGQAEYSPGMTGDMISQKEQEGAAAVQQLDDEYNAKVAEINTALAQNRYQAAATLTQELSDIQDKALTLMQANAQEAQATTDALRAQQQKTQLQASVAALYNGGMKDPASIQAYLNQNGGTATLEDISSIIKIIAPDESLSGTSSDYQTFTQMQKDEKVPADWSYFDFLNAQANARKVPAATGADAEFKFSNAQISQLLSGNFTQGDIQAMQSDIAKYGVNSVVDGLPAEQQSLIRRVLATSGQVASTAAEQFITADYLKNLYGPDALKKAADDAGYGGWFTSTDDETTNYLNDLMQTVQSYRDAGYNDQDILKMMQ